MTDWAKVARATVAARVRAEVGALRHLHRSLHLTTTAATAQFAVIPTSTPRQAAERAIRIVGNLSASLAADMAGATMLARNGARTESIERLAVEWALAAELIRAAGFAPPPILEVPPSAESPDADSTAAGQSFSAAWTTATMAMVWTWASRQEGSLAAIPALSAERVDFRIRRIAATETTKAFADARDDGMGWVAERHGDTRWFPALLKVWDATLDRKVCPTCSDLDGKTRPWGVDFPDGAEPGYVHSNCRCVPVTRVLPLPTTDETIPGRIVDDEHPREPNA